MKKTILSTAILLATAVTSQASAADIQMNGFGSVRFGQMVDVDGVNPMLPNLYNDDDLTFKDESLFGIQFSSDLGDGLSATVQLTAEGSNDFDVEAHWAYISYQINENHTVNAGRLATPLFNQSEYELVGFAHNYARLPKSVYWGFDFNTFEGVSLDSQYTFEDYFLTTKLIYGNWDGDIEGINSEFKNIVGANASLNRDWWTVFGGALLSEFEGDIDSALTIPSVIGGVNASGATGAEIDSFLSSISQSGKDGLYMYGGFKVDHHDWLIDYEYAQYEIQDSADAKNKSWYLSLGRRFNEYTVTYVHEDYSQDSDYSVLSSVENPILQATGQSFVDALAARNMTIDSIHVRWDFTSSAALKADYFFGSDDRVEVGDFSGFSVGVDFIF